MRVRSWLTKAAMVTVSCVVIACSLSDPYANKNASVSLITTPPSYYSSAKARSLGAKYKENLDRLAERIVRTPKTANLQFANNISSVGGIGFFTHSATNTPDERYLEVIVSTPESFDNKQEFGAKLGQIFATYGSELLAILASDPAIYQENDVSGYGLNLTWQSIVQASAGSRIIVEGAVMYFKKETVGAFLHQNMDQKNVLTGAIIFAAEEHRPLKLVSYHQTDPKPDTRLPIHEESLGVRQAETKTESGSFSSQTRIEAGRESTLLLEGAGEKGSISSAAVVPMTAASQQSADGKRAKEFTIKKPLRTKSADAVEKKQDLPQRVFPKATADSGRAAVNPGEEPSLQNPSGPNVPPSMPSSTQGAPTAKPRVKTEVAENASVIKRYDETADLQKAEDKRKSDSAEISASENGGRRDETPRAATTNGTHGERSGVVKLAEGALRIEGQSSDETKAAVLSKTLSGVQGSSVKEVQAEAKSKAERVTSEQVALTRRNSVADSQKTPGKALSEVPAEGSRVDTAKPLLNTVAKSPRHDSPLGTDSDRSARERDAEAPVVANSTLKAVSLPPAPAIGTAKENSPTLRAKLPNEQIALLKKSSGETGPEKRAVAESPPKALEGYVIQVGFNNKSVAQHWGLTLERRGYAVSLTEADGAGLVRLRLGNFAVREEAERQLKSLKQEGLSGIVINLPRAYRPEARAQAAEESETQSARTE